MFETTTTDGVPMNVRVSFWQCVKAGIGFTIGAGVMTFVFGLLWAIFYARVFFPTMIGALLR